MGDNLSGICVEGATFSLTVQLGGKGAGSVVSEPSGLTCSAEACTARFRKGAIVELSATAATGSFISWTHACRGQGGCTVTMDSDRSVGALFGNPGEALWAMQLGGTNTDYGVDIAIDRDDNLIAVGAFTERFTLATSEELVSSGLQDIYVVKIAASSGAIIWARKLGGAMDDLTPSVDIDELNNVYVAGSFQGEFSFGDRVLRATGTHNAFVVQFHPDGEPGWAQLIRSTLTSFPNGIAANSNRVTVVGSYIGSLTVDTVSGPKTFTSAGDNDIFISSMSKFDGSIHWVRSFGGSSRDIATSVAIDSNDSIAVIGDFANSVNFERAILSTGAASVSHAFLLKLGSTDGRVLLARQFGDNAIETSGKGVGVDSGNNILVTGSYYGNIDFGCPSNPAGAPPGQTNAFLAKFTEAGSCLWANGFEGIGNYHFGMTVAVNMAGEVALSGGFCGTMSLGGQTLTSASVCDANDMFAARFNDRGMHVSSVRRGGMGSEYGVGIAQSLDGRFFVTGAFDSFAEFGDEPFINRGMDSFIVGFAPL